MKRTVDDFAIFGGEPAFQHLVHVGRPNIGNRADFLRRVDEMFDRGWLTNYGPIVGKFEQRIADFVGVEHCIAVCNATIGLEITIRALGLTGEVIVPSFTFIATAHSLQWQEITPVFCDVDPHTHTLDTARIEELITPRTTAILGVHLWGRACDVPTLTAIAKKHNLKLLFDAAHAFGCSCDGQMIGSFGEAEIFSFHSTKFINSFEGGAVVTNDAELAAKIRLMQNFGFADYDQVVYIGTNGKMSEISAAMGLTSLESLDTFAAINYHNYKLYQDRLGHLPGISMVTYDEREAGNYQYIVVEVDKSLTAISRDRLVEMLWAENIRARRYFYPGCHRMEPYRSYFPHAYLLLPQTERLAERVMALPTGASVSHDEIETICAIIRLAIANGSEASSRLQAREVAAVGAPEV